MKLHFLKKKPLPKDGAVKKTLKYAFFPVKCDSCKTYLWLEEYLLKTTYHRATKRDDLYNAIPYVYTTRITTCDECLHLEFLNGNAHYESNSSVSITGIVSNRRKSKSKKTISKKSSTIKKSTKNQIDIKSKEEFI